MKSRTLVFRSLRFYFRTHLGVLAGCAISAAVLVGALFIGDSVKASLRRTALTRLGPVHHAIDTGRRFFRDDLGKRTGTAAMLRIDGMAIAGESQINQVVVLGVNDPFIGFALKEGEVSINRRLAAALGVKKGDDLALRMFQPGELSRDAPLVSKNEKLTQRRLMTVAAVLPDAKFGRFSLRSDQTSPYNAFVHLPWLQETLELEGKANVLVGAKIGKPVREVLALEDAGVVSRRVGGRVQLESPRIYLDPAVAEAFPDATGALTYLADSITAGSGKTTPYSFMTAITPGGLGPVPAGMKDDEIIVNQWLASRISIRKGDPVTVTYSELQSDNSFTEKTRSFTVLRVDPMSETERDLVPEFPGLTDVDSCADWDIGITKDPVKLADKFNELYWKTYRQTPKAFVTLAAGQAMWGNRFGDLMALRFETFAEAEFREKVDAAALGLEFQSVREDALRAVSESMDLGQLFLGMSFFLIIASLLLTAMLFVFTVEQRSREMGVLLAVGHTPGQVRRLLLLEGSLLASIGAVIGVPLGWVFARFLIRGLDTAWSGAVAGASIQFHPSPASAVIGAVAATVVSALAMGIVLRRQARKPVRELIADAITEPEEKPGSGRVRVTVFGVSVLGAVVVALLSGGTAPMFFLAGSLMLIGGIALIRILLLRKTYGKLSVHALGVRNASRRHGRSLATAGMLACGCFMVFSVSAFKEDFAVGAAERLSPTGGFEMYGESTVPVNDDLGSRVVPVRMREGDDASCLNLNQAPAPTLLGLNVDRMKELGAFTDQWDLLDEMRKDGEIPAIVGDSATQMWKLKRSVLDYTDERGRPFKVRLVASLPMRLSLFQGRILISERHFTRLFPSEGGYRVFLGNLDKELTKKYETYGLDVVPAVDRLKEFYTVESTYLTMFLVLGGLGLLLGTAGMGVLVLRNVLERRSELALLRAVGYSQGQAARVVLAEHFFVLSAGLIVGVLASALAIGPSLARPGVTIPFNLLGVFLVGVVVLSWAWIWSATRVALGAPLVPALRNE